MAYIDYSKAFDTVCHSKLAAKLAATGITGNLLKWLKDFLNCRTQVTRVGMSLSDTVVDITSGVVQGSCLGPLLFMLYINDVVTLFDDKIRCKLYADDVKLYSVVNTQADSLAMQEKLDQLETWSNTWQLKISVKKCLIINIGRQGVDQYQYKIGD